jgi:hypothetical protein
MKYQRSGAGLFCDINNEIKEIMNCEENKKEKKEMQDMDEEKSYAFVVFRIHFSIS